LSIQALASALEQMSGRFFATSSRVVNVTFSSTIENGSWYNTNACLSSLLKTNCVDDNV